MRNRVVIPVILSLLAGAALLAVGCGEGSDRFVSPTDTPNNAYERDIVIEPPTSVYPGSIDINDTSDLDDTVVNQNDTSLTTGDEDDDYDGPWFKDKKGKIHER